MKKIGTFLYCEFWWGVHNLIGHPVYQLLWWLSLCGLIRGVARAGDWFHELTLPYPLSSVPFEGEVDDEEDTYADLEHEYRLGLEEIY